MRIRFQYTLLLAVLLVGCSAKAEPKSKVLVLDYGELGPSVLTYEAVGNDWFQWNNHGDSDPNTFDDVKIVVYRRISLDDVKQMYPVDQKKKLDFRYIDYATAIELLNKYEDEPDLEIMRATKKKIIETLGS